jgi:GTP cyclohydrolase I
MSPRDLAAVTELPGVVARSAAAAAVADLLAAFGLATDPHTADTPARVARAWETMLAGYTEDPGTHLERTFPAPHDAGPVVVSGIQLVSTCAHHLLPFTGWATVAYQPAPGAPIVGLSKLARVVHGYAARLQVQERIGTQVADAVMGRLNPLWAAVYLTATHQCMSVRGVREPAAVTTTRTLRGIIADSDLELVASAHGRAGTP